MNSTLRVEKVISSLPTEIQPNTMYIVRVGTGIDIYVSDATGSIAHKHNSPIGGEPGGAIDNEINYWDMLGEFTPGYPKFNINGNTLIEGDNIKGKVQLPLTNALSVDQKHNYRNTSLKFNVTSDVFHTMAQICLSNKITYDAFDYDQTKYLYMNLYLYEEYLNVAINDIYYLNVYKNNDGDYNLILDIDSNGVVTFNGELLNIILPNEPAYLNFTKISDYPIFETFSYDFTDVVTSNEGPIKLPEKTNSFYICNNTRFYNNVSYKINDLLLVKDSPDDITIINSTPSLYSDVIFTTDDTKLIEPIYPNENTAAVLEKVVDTTNEYIMTPINSVVTLLYKNMQTGVFRIHLNYLTNVGAEIRIVLSPASYEINSSDPMYNIPNIQNGVYISFKKYEDYILVDVMGQSFKTTDDYMEASINSYSISVYSITHYIYYKDIFNLYFIYIDSSYTNKPIKINNECTNNIIDLNKSSARPGDILLSKSQSGVYNDIPIYMNSKYLLLENNKLELLFGGPDNNRPPHGMFKGIISESTNFYNSYRPGDMFIYKKDDETYSIGFTDKDNNLYTVQGSGDQKPTSTGIAYGDFSNNNHQLLNIDSKTLLSDMLATLLANADFNMIDGYYHSIFTVDSDGKTDITKIKDKPSPLASIYYAGYNNKRDTNIVVDWDKPCYYLNPDIQDSNSRFIIDANQYLNYETVVEVNNLSTTFSIVPSHSIIIGLFNSEQAAITANSYIRNNRHNNFLGVEIRSNSYRVQLVDYNEFAPFIDLPADSILNIKMVYNNMANTLVINITDNISIDLPVSNLSWKSDFHPYLSINGTGSQESYTYKLKIKGKSLVTNDGQQAQIDDLKARLDTAESNINLLLAQILGT